MYLSSTATPLATVYTYPRCRPRIKRPRGPQCLLSTPRSDLSSTLYHPQSICKTFIILPLTAVISLQATVAVGGHGYCYVRGQNEPGSVQTKSSPSGVQKTARNSRSTQRTTPCGEDWWELADAIKPFDEPTVKGRRPWKTCLEAFERRSMTLSYFSEGVQVRMLTSFNITVLVAHSVIIFRNMTEQFNIHVEENISHAKKFPQALSGVVARRDWFGIPRTIRCLFGGCLGAYQSGFQAPHL